MAKTLNEVPDHNRERPAKLAAGCIFKTRRSRCGIWLPEGQARRRLAGPLAQPGAGRELPAGTDRHRQRRQRQADGGLFTFLQAETQARQGRGEARREAAAAAEGAPTVRSAVEAYIAERDARDSRRRAGEVRSDAGQRLRRYVLGQEKRGKQKAIPAAQLADVALHALREADLLKWRAGLPEVLKVTAKQRTVNDLKAALNGAYAAHRSKLDPTLPAIIKHGLKAEQDDDDEAVPLARENQILTDAQIAR